MNVDDDAHCYNFLVLLFIVSIASIGYDCRYLRCRALLIYKIVTPISNSVLRFTFKKSDNVCAMKKPQRTLPIFEVFTLFIFYILDKLIKQIRSVLRAWTCFRMVLYRKTIFRFHTHPGNRVVI